MAADLKRIVENNKILNSQNSDWRSYFQDLADFILPRKAWITTVKSKGERLQFNYLYDSTAIRSARTAAAGFHSNLTNPSSKWFGLETRNKMVMKNHSIQKFFYDSRDAVLGALNNTNFDTSMQEAYMDGLVFGTLNILQQADIKKKIRFTTIPIEQYNLEEDANGNIIAVYRNFKLTPIEAYMLWGDKAGKIVRDIIRDYEKEASTSSKAFTDMDFLHYVGPRERRDFTKKDSLNMPFESVWIEPKGEDGPELIDEKGFEELPYHAGRWYKDASDVFGFSPAMDVLADIKLLNAAKRTTLRRAMKEADPPISSPYKGYMAPLNFNPGSVNYRDSKHLNDKIEPLVWNSNFQITKEFMEEVKQNIMDGFYVNLFRSLAEITKQMTVPEVQRRIAEAMTELGPVVGRLTAEVHSPLILRTFFILYRNGELPAIPEELYGQDFDPMYLSPLAKAQREYEMQSMDNFLTRVGNIAAVMPQVLDKIEEDKTVDVMAEISGVSPEILRSPENIKKIREQRAKAQQAQAQLQALQQGAEVAKTGGEAAKHIAGAKNEAQNAGK